MSQTRTVAIAAGGNVGDAARAVRDAMFELSRSPLLRRVNASPLYRTAPVRVPGGAPDPGGPYINAALTAETSADPHQLLDLLHQTERRLGRDRAASPHGGPRPIDLDLLVVGELTVATEVLTLPHPRMHERAFVLVPLADIAPGLDVPGPEGPGGGGRTVAELLAALGPLDTLAVERIEP